MISVVIPTLNAESGLAPTLAALVPAAVEGIVREVIVVDGGSSDRTREIADGAGAVIIAAEGGRGTQLAAGAMVARGPWLLFLHADTILEPGWESEARALIERVDAGKDCETAAAFRFALDDTGLMPHLLERMVSARCAVFRLPYGDQGLLIPRPLYDKLGGYRPYPLMEDVDMVRRLGRRRTKMLRSRAVTSAVRYRREGYMRRSTRNLVCLALFYLRVSPATIKRFYG